VTGWIYSYIAPIRDTVVAKEAQGLLTLLIAAWYMAMSAVSTVLQFVFLLNPLANSMQGAVTVLMAVLCRLGCPMKHRMMAAPYELLGLLWGATWLLLMVAEVSISKANEVCKDMEEMTCRMAVSSGRATREPI
jgi:hypothetical protein